MIWNIIIIIIIAVIVLCIVSAAAYIYKVRNAYRHIPGPDVDSFWSGHLGLLATEFKKGKFFEQILYELALKYGHTFKLFIYHHPLLFTADPESVKDLLVTGGHSKSPKIYKRASQVMGARCLGNGLVTILDEEMWSKKRRLMNPAFNRSALAGLMAEFNEMACKLVSKLSEYADGKTKIKLEPIIRRAAVDSIAKIGFGKDFDSLPCDSSPFLDALTIIMEGILKQAYEPFSKISPWKRLYRQRIRDAVKLVRDTGKTLILDRLRSYRNNETVRNDLLAHIIHILEEHGDFEDVLDDFVTFFIAGEDTTTSVIASSIMEVGRHPEIKERVKKELEDVIGDTDYIEFEDIGKLRYLDMVFKEILRLYPPAASTCRYIDKDHKIGGYLIPGQTDIYISTYVSSRLPQLIEDPLSFNPERFSADSKDRPGIYASFPFTLGPRMCLGQNFAKIEVKLILAKFFQKLNYALDPNQSFDMTSQSTLQPKDGVICTLTMRSEE